MTRKPWQYYPVVMTIAFNDKGPRQRLRIISAAMRARTPEEAEQLGHQHARVVAGPQFEGMIAVILGAACESMEAAGEAARVIADDAEAAARED